MIQNLLKQKADESLCAKLLELCDAMLAKITLMPVEAQEAWNREIVASVQRIEEMKALFQADPKRETTHKDSCVVMMHFTLANQFANLLRDEGERRKEEQDANDSKGT